MSEATEPPRWVCSSASPPSNMAESLERRPRGDRRKGVRRGVGLAHRSAFAVCGPDRRLAELIVHPVRCLREDGRRIPLELLADLLFDRVGGAEQTGRPFEISPGGRRDCEPAQRVHDIDAPAGSEGTLEAADKAWFGILVPTLVEIENAEVAVRVADMLFGPELFRIAEALLEQRPGSNEIAGINCGQSSGCASASAPRVCVRGRGRSVPPPRRGLQTRRSRLQARR